MATRGRYVEPCRVFASHVLRRLAEKVPNMVQGYYTLQEAAQALGLPPEELKQMAQRNQIRSFQDRGTWRFRVQDIQELARQRGAASDMELVLGEASRSPQPKSAGPKSGPRSPGPKTPATPGMPKSGQPKSPAAKSPKPHAPEVFDCAVDTGAEGDFSVEGDSGKRSGSKRPSPQPQSGSDSDVKLVSETDDVAVGASPPPEKKHGSDSDVKLVGASSDSDVKLVGEAEPRTPKAKPAPGGQATPPVGKKPSKLGGPATPDSGVRIVPSDSDSDVKIIGATDADVPLGEQGPKFPSDSDIRREASSTGVGRGMNRGDEGMLTEEINLDEELKKHPTPPMPQAKVKPKSKLPKFPQSSPFELSEVHPEPPAPAKPDSSDYDLTPGPKAGDSSDDFSLELPDDSDFNVQ